MSSVIRSSLALLCAAIALGCRQPPSQPPLDPPLDPSGPSVAGLPTACPLGLRFADYEWVPDDARLATSIHRDDPDLPLALITLARMTEAEEVALPVSAALDFRNLPMQLGNLDRMLDELGDGPAELVELHGPTGDMVWLWPSACPPALLGARLLERWQIMLRADPQRPGLRLGAGSADGFPFDVITIVTLAEQRVGLTRVGQGAKIGAWLRESAQGGADGPGRALADLDEAPLRSILGGASLLTSTAATAPEQRHLRVRVTGSGWDTSAPPPPPPGPQN